MKKPLVCPTPDVPNPKRDYLLNAWGCILGLIGVVVTMYWFLRHIPSYKSVRFGEHMHLPNWLGDAIQFIPLVVLLIDIIYMLYSTRRMYVIGFDFTVSGSDLHFTLHRPISGNEHGFPIERLSRAQLTTYVYPKIQSPRDETKREVKVKVLDNKGNEYLLRKRLTQLEVEALKSACVAAGTEVQEKNILMSFQSVFHWVFLLLILCLGQVAYWFY